MKTIIALLVSAASSFGVALEWTWSEGDLGGFRIYWDRVPGLKPPEQAVFADVGKVTSYNIDPLIAGTAPGTELYFVVTAYDNGNAESKPSNEVSYKKPVPIATPTPTPLPTPAPTPAPLPPHMHTWEEITGKPVVFPNEPHTHVVPATESSQ